MWKTMMVFGLIVCAMFGFKYLTGTTIQIHATYATTVDDSATDMDKVCDSVLERYINNLTFRDETDNTANATEASLAAQNFLAIYKQLNCSPVALHAALVKYISESKPD